MASRLQRLIGSLVSDREETKSTRAIPAGPNATTASGRPTWHDAFPPHLDTLVDQAAAVLPPAEIENSGPIHIGNSGHSWQPPRVDGYPVQIPARMYNDASPLLADQDTGGIQPLILACMYSRHHDGFVRQKAVARLLGSNHDFVAPYIVQMLGGTSPPSQATFWQHSPIRPHSRDCTRCSQDSLARTPTLWRSRASAQRVTGPPTTPLGGPTGYCTQHWLHLTRSLRQRIAITKPHSDGIHAVSSAQVSAIREHATHRRSSVSTS